MPCHCTLLELLVVTNMPFGPSLSEALFKTMQEGLGQFLRETDAENPLFQAFYPEICADHGWQDDAGYGSAEHMQQGYMSIATCDCFRVKGSKVAMRSFFAWSEVVAAESLPTWHTRCLHGVAARVVPRW